MFYAYDEPTTGGTLQLHVANDGLQRNAFGEADKLLTIAWNRGPAQHVDVDGLGIDLPQDALLLLITSHTYRFSDPGTVTAWRFNREFYCIVDHDKEVSCAGFLFYGFPSPMLILPDPASIRKLELLNEVFVDEYETHDNIQGEMLRMLLKRLIIMLTRLGKDQHLKAGAKEPEYDVVRTYSLLVEKHFRQLHRVADYAELMFKSPKTLSNLFRRVSDRTPLQIIRQRIALEGKRLLLYSDKSVAEVADELGFGEPSHFSRFFKAATGVSPTALRE